LLTRFLWCEHSEITALVIHHALAVDRYYVNKIQRKLAGVAPLNDRLSSTVADNTTLLLWDSYHQMLGGRDEANRAGQFAAGDGLADGRLVVPELLYIDLQRRAG